MFAFEKSFSQLRKYVVLPITDSCINGKELIYYWHKNLRSVLIHGATDQFVQGNNSYQDLSSIHLIYTGYHSQGAFRFSLKLFL